MTDSSAHSKDQPDPTDLLTLVMEVLQRAQRLLSSEIALAKEEVAQAMSHALGGLMMLAFAGFLVISGINVLTAAAVAGLAQAGLSVAVASVIVAGVVFALAAAFYVFGKSRINPRNLRPDRTMNNVRQDIQTIKENANV